MLPSQNTVPNIQVVDEITQSLGITATSIADCTAASPLPSQPHASRESALAAYVMQITAHQSAFMSNMQTIIENLSHINHVTLSELTSTAAKDLDNDAPPNPGFEKWRPRGSDGRSICEWLNDVNTRASLARLSASDTLAYAKLALCEVEGHFAALDPVIANDWDKFQDWLKRTFRPPIPTHYLQKELSRIRMHDKNLHSYTNELVRLFSLYDANVKPNEALSGPMRLHYFINGLPEIYQFELLRRDISSFEEAHEVIWRFHTARHPELFSSYAHKYDSMELDGVDRPRTRSSTSPFHLSRSHSRESSGDTPSSRRHLSPDDKRHVKFPKTKYPYRRNSPPRSDDDSAEASPLVSSRPPYSDRHCHSTAYQHSHDSGSPRKRPRGSSATEKSRPLIPHSGSDSCYVCGVSGHRARACPNRHPSTFKRVGRTRSAAAQIAIIHAVSNGEKDGGIE